MLNFLLILTSLVNTKLMCLVEQLCVYDPKFCKFTSSLLERHIGLIYIIRDDFTDLFGSRGLWMNKDLYNRKMTDKRYIQCWC